MGAAVADRRGEANPFYGRSHTQEAKDAIGRANRGRSHTQEAKDAIAEAKRGVPRSPEVRQRIANSVRMAVEAKRAVGS